MEILWSPNHEDKFLTFSSELSLYKVEPWKEDTQQTQRLSPNTAATLLAVNSDQQYLKCVAWYPQSEPDHLIAVGQANGRVVLTSLCQGSKDPRELTGKEFIPRHARQCNMLAWDPCHTNLLAAGMEKYRADHCILVWDVLATPFVDLMATPERRGHILGNSADTSSGMVSKPMHELGLSETVLSLSWFKHDPKTLLAGMNNKHIRIFDLRDTGRAHMNTTLTKAVYGVAVDPYNCFRIASYVDTQVAIWDTRNFDKPVLSLTENRSITRMSWSPTRMGLLATISKDSSVVKLYDIQHVTIGDEVEPAIVERLVQPYGQHAVASFAWHPTHENRLLSATPSGTIKDTVVFERITLNWSPYSNIVWACGRKLLQYDEESEEHVRDDISTKMKQRALSGYGLKVEQVWENGLLCGDDAGLKNVWSWLDLAKSLKEEGKQRINSRFANYKLQGVLAILKGELMPSGFSTKSDVHIVPWVGMERQQSIQQQVYRNECREMALMLCGWGFEKDNSTFNDFLDRLQSDGFYERAAAIALFNLKIRKAIEILHKGSTPKDGKAGETASNLLGGDINLNVVAMALSGFTEEKKTLWREMCSELRTQLSSSYLRAMFAFLTCDDAYEEVLSETGIAIQDRVAIAAMYLSDAKMMDYVEKLTVQMADDGNLDGILLTGLTREGLELLQRYVDLTSDVQSTCFIMAHATPDVMKDVSVKQWAESYRDLLDVWRLWHQRALFDVHWFQGDAGSRPPQQVTVCCNFCSKSISTTGQGRGPRRPYLHYTARTPATKSKVTCCPGCRKPLPRCALCLMNMGTASGMGPTKTEKIRLQVMPSGKDGKPIAISSWFTWCQTCRHGGHANHITEWFREHADCPVTGCNCRCMTLDTVSKASTGSSSTSQHRTAGHSDDVASRGAAPAP
ncbi:PREDICTED: WD repeat-containing protein mio-like [Priapulus caudatus]|uniref:WD repeat-containing protein mio-like n=1 Tax=Priapulus caudatus TaxID=37621 RepID=A0ABM1EL87_PRICU|nr:PREDICTED: WD repeat-containing protein mio-like [Priapulus caudatus]XP_014672960.1 PREDICTED: WD repeat-containing protein mio-like [Priapulus caudatus]XP_014672961.1 PREDICTED: WD repeat-containing protein mio-like [Priapulus caudatus]